LTLSIGMAHHTQLPIYRAAYSLLDAITDLARNMPRDFKTSIGTKLRDEAVEITTLVFRANVAREKAPHIEGLIERGVDFVGQVIKPHRRHTRRRTVAEAIRRTAEAAPEDLLATANSYFGLLGQATRSHHDRALLGNTVRDRGHSVNYALTKTYRRAS